MGVGLILQLWRWSTIKSAIKPTWIKSALQTRILSQGLIKKEKVHINCEKRAQISILANKIAT